MAGIMVQGTMTSRFVARYPRYVARATRSAVIPRTDDGRAFPSRFATTWAPKSVLTYPGQTVSTLILSRFNSIRAPLEIAFTANLLAEYIAINGTGICPATLEILMMEPPPALRIAGATACMQ